MLEIKTIITPLDTPETFDERVNEAIADGWTLMRRDVITTTGSFYAELEREVEDETDDEDAEGEEDETARSCDTCKYESTSSRSHPCCVCSTDADLWEPKQQEEG